MIKQIFLAGIILLGVATSIGCEAVRDPDATGTLIMTNALAELDSSNPKVREKAVYRLSMYYRGYGIYPPDFIEKRTDELPERLLAIMGDEEEHADVRIAVMRTIHNFYKVSEEALELIEELRADPDPKVRSVAIEMTPWLIVSLQDMLDGLNDPDPLIREKIALIIGGEYSPFENHTELGKSYHKKFSPMLAGLLRGGNLDTSVAGAIGLVQLGDDSAEVDKVLAEGIRSSIYFRNILDVIDQDSLGKYPNLALEMLRLIENPPIGLDLGEVILDINPKKDIVDQLERLAPDSILYAALKRLDSMGVEIDVIKQDMPYGSLEFSRVDFFNPTEYFIILHYENGRNEFLHSWDESYNTSSMRMKKTYPDYLTHTILKITRLDDSERVVDAVIKYLGSDPEGRRTAAKVALRNIDPQARGAIPKMIKILDESDASMVYEPTEILATWGLKYPDQIVPVIIRNLQDEEKAAHMAYGVEILGPLARDAEGAMLKLLDPSFDGSICTPAINALSSIYSDDEDYIAKLVDLISRFGINNNLSADFVLQGLAGLDYVLLSGKLEIVDSSEHLPGMWSTLRDLAFVFKEEYNERCLSRLDDPDEHVRLHAVIALSSIHEEPEKIIEVLRQVASSDESDRVRKAAEGAIAVLEEVLTWGNWK